MKLRIASNIIVGVLLFSTVFVSSHAMIHAQESNATTASRTLDLKTLVVATEAKSDSEIAIPPASFSFIAVVKSRNEPDTTSDSNLPTWIRQQSALNGLQSADLHPWHIIVTYDQFDEDGDNAHSGTYEEFWASPTKYTRIYKSDNFNQTEYATDHGLYRRGDQRWPTPEELYVRAAVVDPFAYAATLQGFHVRYVDRSFSGYNLQCALIENESANSDPAQYCFESEGSVLRYVRGYGWNQITYNRIVSFQGRNIAQDIDVTNAGKPNFKLHVRTIESLSQVDEADFLPPPDALQLGDRISGVQPRAIRTSYPEFPASLRGQHFSVEVDFVVGKDGRVVSMHAVGGPPEGQRACEEAVRKSLFAPYFVLDKPVEVETKIVCNFQ
jgi:hypothetical protein